MRVTDHMTNQMAKQSGLPIYPNRDLTKKGNELLNALDKNSTGISERIEDRRNRSNYLEIVNVSDKLGEDAKKWFSSENESDNIYQRAIESSDVSEIVTALRGITGSYNETIAAMKESADGLNELYLSEMKKAAKDQAETFEKVGITVGKDGKLAFEETKIKTENIETLREAMEPFANKLSILSERISRQSQAQAESISTRYDAYGNVYATGNSKYDFWG